MYLDSYFFIWTEIFSYSQRWPTWYLLFINFKFILNKFLQVYDLVVNISQIKHTWFSFVFLFVTDLSNYNAVVFTGKRSARIEGVHAFILSMKRNHRTNHIRKDPQRVYETYLVLIKRFTLILLNSILY